MQKTYNELIIGKNLSKEAVDLHTQQLALCAHAELSSLVNATNFKKHHGNLEQTDRDTILYESIDVLRYIQAIQNLWDITSDEVENAFYAKESYLNSRKRIQDNPWSGQPVVIVDMDDVIVDFREGFSTWLQKSYNIEVDVNSKEYYFITALQKSNVNPEEVFSRFISEDGFADLKPVADACLFMKSLKSAGFWVQILTARPEEDLRCMYNTYQWLDNHNIPYDDIAFSTEKFRWCAKSKYYDKKLISFAIDDSPKHATEYAKHGIDVLVPEKSYNKNIGQDVFYYSTFSEALNTLRTYLNT